VPPAEVVIGITPNDGDGGDSPAPAASEDSSIQAPAASEEDAPANPALDPASDPHPGPADDTETAKPAPAAPKATDTVTAPADDATSKPAETASPAPAEAKPAEPESASVTPSAPGPTPEPSTAPAAPTSSDPIVAEIRAKLKDPALRKAANSDDVAALETFYAARSGAPLWITTMGFSARAQALIAEIQNAPSWGLPADAFDLPRANDLPATTGAQAIDEIKLSLAALKYARYARGGRMVPGRVSNLFDQKPELVAPKTVLAELESSASPAAYLVSLQPKHSQFAALRKLLVKAVANAKARGRKPTADPMVQRILVNMERWRWMPADLGNYYVWNNVPSFITRVMKDGKSIYVEKVIVGQLKYATPLFSAPMRSIEFNPDWTVPDTIKYEDLAPRLKQGSLDGSRDISILTNNKLSVSYQGKPVNAASVDWSRVNFRNYTFTQEPGPDNVLGVLKFNFPNRHAIYMHDTLQPELFNETDRTLSHGCIRVRQPDRLAALLLAEDKGWSAQQVKDMLAKGKNTGVVLKTPLPVHLTYFTAVIDAQGKFQTYNDVYGLDKKMAALMFGKTDSVSAETGGKQKKSAWNGSNFPLSGMFGN
jgi:L,D-transpeptidase YcbB